MPSLVPSYDPKTQRYWFVLSEFIQLTGNENGVYF